ncbi:DUF4123 domain-containing protein [Rhodovulum sulfidophilum]|uniref:DUF4123 domain-containing protein n=1 Tax=Rhodovulum sulfidophilum TaxID=35806 RepID=A0ABS1S239_RHOSU|nr:DUF4123 domain-containing protein [Rhodovulum sulfidophilum]MBL3611244.1 DUF4123 domain-containing protein [Rhodovulum sulfidophilum]MCE8458323.1 DUF4123 domain-containing protein [Rhodovulum sulfidophilum]
MSAGSSRHPALAAVLAPGSADAQSVLARRIAEHAPFAVAEAKPVALESWLQTGFGNWDLLAALPELTAEVPVRLVAQDHVPAQTDGQSWLRIEAPVELGFLDEDFGQFPRRSVPKRLEPLFWTGPEKTFAVIDAAAFPALPERLSASDMRHGCLFEGKAEQELGEAAPWLVELAPDQRIVRDLFAGAGRDGRDPVRPAALFLRSGDTFSDLRAHLRQFVRLKSREGGWAYFHFWEGPYLFGLIEAVARNELPEFTRFFVSRKAKIQYVGHLDPHGTWHGATCVDAPPKANAALMLTPEVREILQRVRGEQFLCRLREYLGQHQGPGEDALSEQHVQHLVREARQYGFTLEKAIANYARARLTAGRKLDEMPWFRELLSHNLHQLDTSQVVLETCLNR